MAGGWRPDMDGPRALLAALATVTFVALVVVASTSTAAFGTYNPAWDGASDLREVAHDAGAEAAIARDVSSYDEASATGTVAVVLAPREGYAPAEADRLRRFLDDGGTLVIADDFGRHANPLLQHLGAESRIEGQLLRDERHFYRTPAMPLATAVTAHPWTAGIEEVTLNHASSVEPNGATVLYETSEFAYVDADRNGVLDSDERVDTYPVATVETVGDGTLVVVGDPSVFINVMLEQPGNRAFVDRLFGGHERVLLDYSHAGGFPPLSLALLILRDEPWLQALAVLAGLVAIGAWASGFPSGRRGEPGGSARGDDPALTEDSLVAFLHRRHPDWEESRVRRVVRGIMSRRRQSRADE